MRYVATSVQFRFAFLVLAAASIGGCRNQAITPPVNATPPPAMLLGRFVDDYEISYTISENTWIMEPGTKFNIIRWNVADQYLLAENDAGNRNDAGRFTRIDYLRFEPDRAPYVWGYCYSTFDAEDLKSAERVAIADRSNPRHGCNGHPFSRMKPHPPKETK